MKTVEQRLMEYAAIDTGSSETSGLHPSTDKQWDLARVLEKELSELGLNNVRLTDKCYIYAELPANVEGQPAIGLIAHMDTAPAVPTGPVKPSLITYEGGDIVLASGAVLSPAEYQSLNSHIGHQLVVTDGTTLLGGDNKAGVAEIITAAEYLLAHPEVKHGKICIAFTPDEEIGGGTDFFDIPAFGADFAYTVDGGPAGEYECENFNGASADVKVNGVNIHPGSAKDKMKNACRIAMEFAGLLPDSQTPEHTEGREGFYHLCEMQGDETTATLKYIIRDHDSLKYEQKKDFMRACATLINARYGEGTVELDIVDKYRNMVEVINQYPDITERAFAAIRAAGDEPKMIPIRGGTDGARLSWDGLPCPNLPTGVYNMHSVLEYASVQEMQRSVKMIVALVTAR